MNRFKYDFNSVSKYITDQGYTLLSKEYITSQHRLEILCPKGHMITPCFSEFKRKARCNECSVSKKPTIEEIQNFIAPKGFTLLTKEYVNNHTKMDVQCSKGHIWQIHWNNLKFGNGCPDCYGNRKYTLAQVKDNLAEHGYQLNQDNYVDVSTKINLICPNNHKYEVRYHDFLTGVRCSSCSYQTSNAEQEVLEFVKKHYPNASKTRFGEIISECSKEYSRKELDIYIPELRVAIEYCGLYWHSDASGEKSTKKHINKLNWCRDNNIRLITIFEDEWLNRKDQVKNLLLSVMKVHTFKIGARTCSIKEIHADVAKKFIDSYHIQPLRAVAVSFGLFFNEELVGVISGGKHHRQNRPEFVLQRLCFKSGYQISGGASKLLKALNLYAKSQGYTQIISWSDNRISEGNVYQKLGFSLGREYPEDYSYVLEGYYNKRHSKQALKKTPEERLTGKTEHELRREQGYFRIWDCGKKLWVIGL